MPAVAVIDVDTLNFSTHSCTAAAAPAACLQGYTIPLDKRLAADGRGLQEVAINDQFAKFTEALYIAEQKARSAVEARSKMQRELLAREKERKERELRDLALRARLDRMGGAAGEREPLSSQIDLALLPTF